MTTCCDSRLSWLALEQYHLGELHQDAQRQISSHLTDCIHCKERLTSIEQDPYDLPPLPAAAQRPGILGTALKPIWIGGIASAMVAVVAVILLVIFRADGQLPGRIVAFKGGDLALTLVRERNGAIVENPTGYKDGDRFIVRLTCPGTDRIDWDVVIFQGHETLFPYAAHPPILCGNNVPVPGAFLITGHEPTTVCAVVGDLPDRRSLKTSGIEALTDSAVCTTLLPLR
ncbi:MAG: hypothetical protein QNJ97_24010 [Myxococcota bacterium]|nr:hypothetical protein [Myxococcota bacterium]